MADAVFPVSFRDPTYARLDASTEQKLELPAGLLSSIRENGERTNADRVSEAGARTPYQIIPATRDAAIKKWGIDPWLSPQNAAEVAGLLLKDSLTRSQGDPVRAVAEYHGGTDPANWGPKTKAYVQRVTSAIGDQPAQPAPAQRSQDGVTLPAMAGPSTFDRAQAQMQQEQAPSQLQAIYQAYQSGQMAPEEAQQYEADVRSGAMMLPRGASLKTAATTGPGVGGAVAGAGAQPVPPGVLQAYQSGQMTPQEMVDFEHDARNGAWQLPAGTTPDALFGSAPQRGGIVDGLTEAVTGKQRTTPQVQQAIDQRRTFYDMPETNEMSVGLLKSVVGGLVAGTKERAQIMAANFPGMQTKQDSTGNTWLQSPKDGNWYVIPPGFHWQDVPRTVAAALAFTPAGRATTITGGALAAAGTQAVIEGTQAATGGEFNGGDVVAAGVLGGVVPAATRVIGAAAQPLKALVGRALGGDGGAVLDSEVRQMAAAGRPNPAGADVHAAVTPGGATEAGAGGAQAPAGSMPPGMPQASPPGVIPPVTGAAPEDIAQTVRQAADKGAGSVAARNLAGMVAPSAETTASAERLGISNYLQPDHVTTNDAYRQIVGLVKSVNPAGGLAQAEKEGLSAVAERASKLIDEIGGTTDLSAMDASVKQRMQATYAELSARENDLWDQLRKKVGPTTDTPASNALAFAQQRATELGGEQYLSPMEKMIVAKLSPKGGGDAAMLDALGPAAKQQAMEQGAGAIKQPTYALVDDVRRDVGAATHTRGPFGDADTGLAKQYYGLLSTDQAAVAEAAGAGDLGKAARLATGTRKDLEDDLKALFGKALDLAAPNLGASAGSIVPEVSGAMKAAATGDTSRLLAVLKATPDGMKQEVVASGLSTVFRNAATRGDISFTGYAKWFEGLQRNQQAYAAVMSNLPPAARQQLVDLARVSKGISDSLAARTKTGLSVALKDELRNAPDTLISRMYDLAKHMGKGIAVDAVGGHGAGLAMGLFSALKGNAKPNAVKALDELLTSPEFQHLAATAGTPQQTQTVRSFAYSKAFTKFARAVGNPRELSNRERWVLQALEARNNMER